MQGRLSPQPNGPSQRFPHKTWRDEFERARILGFDAIEWLYDIHMDMRNPLFSEPGRAELRLLSKNTGIAVHSVCGQAFIDGGLVRSEISAMESLLRLIEASQDVGIQRIILPLLETASVQTDEDWRCLLNFLEQCSSQLQESGLKLLFETSVDADALCRCLNRETNPFFGICYDVGNRTADGADVLQEIAALSHMISEVHLKDRRYGGPNVALGSGDVDFDGIFAVLRDMMPPLILETTAGEDWEASAGKNITFVREKLLADAAR